MTDHPESLNRHALLAGDVLWEDTLMHATGTEVLRASAASGVATMPVVGNLQPAGLLHGGATIALAETIGSICAVAHAREVHGEEALAVGTSISATHHRSARHGTVTATAEALHRGRSVATYLVSVTDEEDTLLSTVTVSTQILPPRSA